MLNRIVLIMLMFFCFNSSAMAQKSIVFAVPAAVPPMAFVDEGGEVAGYSVDYIKAVAEAAGFTAVLKNVPWAGIFAGLVRGDFDAICGAVSITEKRKKVVDFSIPYFEAWQALAVQKDSTVKSLDDLKGQIVGGKLGSVAFQETQAISGLEVVGYPDVNTLMAALQAGQVAAIVYDQPQVSYSIKTSYQDSLKVASLVETKTKDNFGIAVKKGNMELLDLLNKGMKIVNGSSAEQKIREKWLNNK